MPLHAVFLILQASDVLSDLVCFRRVLVCGRRSWLSEGDVRAESLRAAATRVQPQTLMPLMARWIDVSRDRSADVDITHDADAREP